MTAFACGRDWYSSIVGYDDWQRVCGMSLTRFSEPRWVHGEPSCAFLYWDFRELPVCPLWNFGLDWKSSPTAVQASFPYTALFPCIEQCHAIDHPYRPFKCPVDRDNDGASYIDGGDDRDEGWGYWGPARAVGESVVRDV